MNQRQKLHLEPPTGWMNDPNGLCFFNNAFHVYFQYTPTSPFGKGDRGWGHYTSPDLLHWNFTGMVLKPDIPEDRNGAYSGSAIEKDGILHIFYTGNVKKEGNYDYILEGREANVIKVTTKDGHQMSEKRVLLRNSDYPDFCSCHVRDPKVWFENGTYYMILGARTKDDKGVALLYTSTDLENWTYERHDTKENMGYMWECPDSFSLNGTDYLSICPQGLPSETYRFQNIYQAGYLLENEFYEWDYGFDFYAPQTFDTPDGRKLLIGWMGLPDIDYENPTTEYGFQHCLTLPRELTKREDGLLLQYPAKELSSLRTSYIEIELEEEDLTLPFDLEADALEERFSLSLNQDLKIEYDGSIFRLLFSSNEFGGKRGERKIKIEEPLKDLRILADLTSLEIYLNHGRYVLSTRFYPTCETLSLKASGIRGKIYSLNSMTFV